MHTIAVITVDDVIAFDLSTPIEVFGWARDENAHPIYRVIVCGESSTGGGMRIMPDHGLDELASADTIIVPGSRTPARTQPREILDALRDAHRRGVRLASICGGAFTLAQAGLLDGRSATTHWRAASLFQELFPEVEVTAESMFREDGGIYTSAGASAGIDLCLELIRRDHGVEVAADAARQAVMPLYRNGGQAPFIVTSDEPLDGPLHELTVWLSSRLDQPITLQQMAAVANVSVRTLNRRFHLRFGISPMTWLLNARVRRAQEMLVGSATPVERIAQEAGFGSSVNFRAQFKRASGVSPRSYRTSFGGSRTSVSH
ncbi:GlxA family transcriptional regulator [uncultured Microbacterium sp.]|uniref:GlxA family transcriptional regulator n=1 Tax=uncultured Microbacterium sp. TaxID=191216 RepID=UPI0035CAA10F